MVNKKDLDDLKAGLMEFMSNQFEEQNTKLESLRSGYQKWHENHENRLKTLEENQEKATVSKIEIQRCYYVGKPSTSGTGQSRPIVAKFLRFTDVIQIMQASRKKPKGTPGGVHEDLPIQWAQARQELHRKFVMPLKRDNVKVKIRWLQDTLYLNDKRIYITDSLESVKDNITRY